MHRRKLLLGLAGSCLWATSCATRSKDLDSEVVGNLAPSSPENTLEFGWGDPGLEPEYVEYNPESVRNLSSASDRMAPLQARVPDFSQQFLDVCDGMVGLNRADNEAEITRFCNLFNLGFRTASGSYTRFCAMGLSYAAALTYFNQNKVGPSEPTLTELKALLIEVGHYHFYPSPSCLDMKYLAQGQRRWVPRTSSTRPEPGWLVLFDWDRKDVGKGGHPRHVGVVRDADLANSRLYTIEFNTSADDPSNGGYVARKNRNLGPSVLGYIATTRRNDFF